MGAPGFLSRRSPTTRTSGISGLPQAIPCSDPTTRPRGPAVQATIRSMAGPDMTHRRAGPATTSCAEIRGDGSGGGEGRDTPNGEDGEDTVEGGFGADRVSGGAGADGFHHLGIVDHGPDPIQDARATRSDRLVWGRGSAATRPRATSRWTRRSSFIAEPAIPTGRCWTGARGPRSTCGSADTCSTRWHNPRHALS